MPAAPDFRLYHGNDLSVLAAVLAAELARPLPGVSLLLPDTIVIPQPAMKRWLQNTLAQAHGIAANLRFVTPGELVREALNANLADGDDSAIADAAMLRWRVWQELRDPALLQQSPFAPLRELLGGDQHERSAWSLAGAIGAAVEKYQAWRRDWLGRWDRGEDRHDWQAELWRRVTRGRTHRAARLDAYLARHSGEAAAPPRGLPARVFAFGCQNVSPDVLRVLASCARSGPLHFFFVSPVASWWGDLQDVRERLRQDLEGPFAADEESPLLRANGAAGRDFVRLLFSYEIVHPSIDLPIYVEPDPALRTGLLHRLQRDLLQRRPPAAAQAPLPRFDPHASPDPSLQIHACATPLRELQVLHDQLRALLEADPTLQPRDIAVLAPDIDHYAPHIHAVFGAGAQERGAIAYAVADAGAAAALPLVAGFLRLLDLPQSRFGANEVLDLLALPAIAQRLQLQALDFERLRDWLERAGARWGLDAAHRVELGAPEEPAYSWAWALQRLLLGHATGDAEMLVGVAPLPLVEGSALELLDGLLQGLRVLARLRRALAQPRTPAQWQVLLLRALEDLLPAQPDDDADRIALQQLRAQLQRFAEEALQAGIGIEVPPQIVRDWFTEALSEADPRQPFLTGGVTFARMVPMRLIPFRVICILGLDDGAFPRRDPVGGLNRIDAALRGSARRIGDRSLREDDRALFLQLFGAATDVLYLSYRGCDPRSGEVLPPAVVVSELLDVAAAAYCNPVDARAGLTVREPVHPFAAEAFGAGDLRRFSYRGEWRVPASNRERIAPRFATAALPLPPAEAPVELGLDQLRRDLRHPLRAFLQHRLGIRLDQGRARLPEDEPFGRDDALRLHALRQRLFSALVASDPAPEIEALYVQLLAEARIAPAAAGRSEVAQLRGPLLRARATWRGWAGGDATEVQLRLPIGRYLLGATLAPVHDTGLLQFRAGKAHGRTRLDLGLEWLMWSACGETRPVHCLVQDEEPLVRPALEPALAHAALARLLDLRERILQQALPLMPDAAWRYADAIGSGKSDEIAFAAARRQWNDRGFGDGSDPWVRIALRAADPFLPGNEALADQFRTLALELYDALYAQTEDGHVVA